MPSTKRQRQRRERAVGEAVAAARLGEAARAHPDASLFFMDDAATETASKRARRAAKKKVATASPTESALLRKFEQRRKARPGHAGARAPKAATVRAPPMEDLWGDAADAGAADEWTAAPVDGCAPATSLRARRRPRRAASAAAAAGGADASGASYNPSKSSHRALLAEAEAIEAARRAAEDAETDWWAERDRRRQVSEDEDEAESDSESASESESDDGGENGADGARPKMSSRSLKKGRAQRNRMKRARLQAFEKRQRDEGKRQRAAFDGLKRLRRELDEREAEAVLGSVLLWATHHLTPRPQPQAAAKAREKARPPKAVPRTAPPAVARADELTDALRSNKATRATGVADLHAALAAAHRPAKRAQPKKQRKLKYRGARLLNRYRERPI